ncbi:Peptidylprolyl isomerase [Aphelenchoides bicaudatus]|nr:Peptidylprolyl isomerase [Aphelenchoides bicaudatus]
MKKLVVFTLFAFIVCHAILAVGAIETESNEVEEKEADGVFEGRRLKWEEEDGLKIEIIKPIKAEDCKLKSRPGDVVEQFYKLDDRDGNEIGSNFGDKPYKFTLGKNQVIPGMDKAMVGLCIGEQRKVVIPPKLGFKKSESNPKPETLYYTVELVSIFRQNPGDTWVTDEGVKIAVTNKIEECRQFSAPGDKIHQHYKLWLEDGTLVESSYTNNQPFVFTLGAKEVIKGIDIGMNQMCEGEIRQLTIPSELAYGKAGSPPDVPSDARLYFVVELHKLIKRDEL